MLYNDIVILPVIRLIAIKLGVLQPEVAEYRDLEVDTGDLDREVHLSQEEDEDDD